ncbi:MAG TPA: sugar ABC transporter ATP-binding protein [Tepidisphaeraceae bacterium]|jgi:ribose transport system ATP-binding protein|nr:sugar ABC transporter ATP-binding protein [Tepidisphaeraceae bacterium]
MREPHPNLLTMRGITKRFPGVLALQDVSLQLGRGEVLALMGENGAGKSTLMKILGGAYQPDGGEISIGGDRVVLSSIAEAKRRGIALIHQELMLAPNLDIAGNIFLGNEQAARARSKAGGGARPRGLVLPLPRVAMRARAAELLARVGLHLSPDTAVSRLTAGQMQMVEIAKALSLDARIIIMDEPTSSLTLGETRQLFKIIAGLRESGMGIIYISHRMEEVLEVADRVTVLRDGKYVGDLSATEATHDRIVSMMVGRPLSAWFPDRSKRQAGESVFEAQGLVVPGAAAGVSFSARRGEILGFAGLVGSGRTELMQVIFGATASLGGAMRLEGRAYQPRHTRDAIRHGVYLAPEDRKRHGLVLPMSIAQNVSLPDIGNYTPRWRLQRRKEEQVATQEVARMRIKTPDIHRKVVNLSGGNQQKVVLGKWLAMRPRVLILDEPTRGIDVGAKAEIYRHMAALADQGITILMVSSDMEEVLGMSDRVAVMHERRIVAVLPREGLSQELVGTLMAGAADKVPNGV